MAYFLCNYAVTADISGNETYNPVTGLNLGSYLITQATLPEAVINNVSVILTDTGLKTHALTGLPGDMGYALYYYSRSNDPNGIFRNAYASGSHGQARYELVQGLTAADAGKTATIVVSVNSHNYMPFEVHIVITLVNKTDVSGDITFAAGSATYNGNVQTHEAAMISGENAGSFTYTYDTVDGVLDGGKPKGAGRYTVTATYESPLVLGSQTTIFTISPLAARVGVGLSAFVIAAGDTLPTPILSYEGLIGGESLAPPEAPTFIGMPTNSGAAGNYPVIWTNAAAMKALIEALPAAANYTIAYTASTTLVVRARPGSEDAQPVFVEDKIPVVIVAPPITPTPDYPGLPIQGETDVIGKVDDSGNITVNITPKDITEAYDKALADAKKNSAKQNNITVMLRVRAGGKAVSGTLIHLPKLVQDRILAKGITSTVVVVEDLGISIAIDLEAMKEISRQARADVNITIVPVSGRALSSDGQKAIGARPVFDTKVSNANGKQVRAFGAGRVSFSMPYILGANERPANVQAIYMDDKGGVHWLIQSVYDNAEKVLRFTTNHLSIYGIGYQKTDIVLTDMQNHWAKEDAAFAISRGLLGATSASTFSPDAAITRGMLAAALGQLANADIASYEKSRFSDVKNDAYYMGYIEWASQNGVINGTGNGQFAPDEVITREQMAAIMRQFAKAIGFTLPRVYGANAFDDSARISAYAKDAVKQMQMAGVILSKTDNLFDPQGLATRAEVSAMLRRFVTLMISSEAMQGWVQNDGGQYFFYKAGRILAGEQTIDGVKYFMNTNGVLKTGWVGDKAGNQRFYRGHTMLVGFAIEADGATNTYYFDKDGVMVSGKWLKFEGKWYYFNVDGSLAKNTQINGYKVDQDGVMAGA